jgi:MerR HTH family regulatory protein
VTSSVSSRGDLTRISITHTFGVVKMPALERRAANGGFSIGELAERLDVHPRTLMVYERMGLVRPARRSNRRSYSQADVRWVQCLREFNHEGGISLQGLTTLLQFVPCWAIRSALASSSSSSVTPDAFPASESLDRVLRAYAGDARSECRQCGNYRGASARGRQALRENSCGVRVGDAPARAEDAPGSPGARTRGAEIETKE